MGKIVEIKGLKCPNHNYVRDCHSFVYESIGGMRPTTATRCIRCGYTMSLHKPQR